MPNRNPNAAMSASLRRFLAASESRADISAHTLATSFRRAVFLLSDGNTWQWQTVRPIQHQLKAGEDDAQSALHYAVLAGWLEVQGDPISHIRLATGDLEPPHTPARVA